MTRFILPSLIAAIPAFAAAVEIDWLSDEVVNRARKAVVTVETGHAFADSGFFATEDGLVITSATNLPGAKELVVVTADGKRLEGVKLLLLNAKDDVAVIATGRKAPAILEVRDDAAAVRAPCVVLYNGGGAFIKAADGVLITRGPEHDFRGSGFRELWSVLLAPDKMGLSGAPVITADGRAAGLCYAMTGTGASKKNLFLPESFVRAALAQARTVTQPLPLPATAAPVSKWGQPWEDTDNKEGMRLFSGGDFADARESFRAALLHHPREPSIMSNLAGACMALGEKVEAEKLLRECLEIAPEQVQNHALLGAVIESTGDDQALLRHCREVTTRHPELGPSWGSYSLILLKLGDKAGALAAAKKFTELQPGLFGSWDVYVLALSANGDIAGAERAREKSIELEDIIFKVRYSAPKRK